MAEPASGAHRSRLASVATEKAEKERRKRSRVTPEQLVHLEQFFSVDRSPTAARRKEISELLGMQERQTQIWFQNRRAKAKLQDGKKGQVSTVGTPPDTPPELAAGYEAELHNLLHEDEPVTIIPCTDLSIGTWRRIASNPGKHDLVAYLCDVKRCLTWFIHSSGYGFKMEIPFDVIIDTEFTNAAPGSGLASFVLSRPPTFYLESYSAPIPGRGTGPLRQWKNCADWTEDQQATKVLKHNLVGSAAQLAHLVRHLNSHISGTEIRLHSLSDCPQAPSSSVSDIQSSARTNFASTGYHHHTQDNAVLHRLDQPIFNHKRSSSLPVSGQQLSLHDGSVHIPITRPPSGVVSEPDPPLYSQYPQHPSVEVDQSTSYSNYSDTTISHHLSCSSLSANSGSSRSFSPHGSHQRPYSAGSVHSLHYDYNNRLLSFPDSLHPPGSTVPTPFETPSPPLLTTAFYPPGSASNTCALNPSYDPAMSVITGMPGTTNSDINS